MPKRNLLFFLALIMSVSLYAIIDQDGDSISDIYEAKYGVDFYPLAVDPGDRPLGDKDNDKYSNYVESIWGTSPLNADPATIPPGYIDTSLISVGSELYDVSFYGMPFKEISLEYSVTLGTWLPANILPFIGVGQQETLQFDGSGLFSSDDRFFVRVRHAEVYSDGDSLSDWEENEIQTNPLLEDTDGDRLDDDVEYIASLNPTSNLDSDNDLMPDDWERYYELDENDPNDATTNLDGDADNNLTEFNNDTDPSDFFNGVLASIELNGSGDNQTGTVNDILPIPLTVRIFDGGGNVVNAPVTFSTPTTGALLDSVNGVQFVGSNSIEVRTDASGLASVYLKLPDTTNTNVDVLATITSGENSASVPFTATSTFTLVAQFTATPATGSDPLLVQFDASSTQAVGSQSAVYQWDFDGDAQTDATGQVAYHFFPEGSYTVGLTVDASGLSDSDSTTISVGPPSGNEDAILRWTFDNFSSGTVSDVTGNNRDGTVSQIGANPSSATGQIGNAIEFTGASAAHVIDDDAENYLNGLAAMSFSVWVKSDNIDSDAGILNGKAPNQSDQPLSFRYDRRGAQSLSENGITTVDVIKVGLMVDTDPGPGETLQVIQIESAENVQSTNWQHFVVTWLSGDQLRLYVDGVEDINTWNDSLNVTGVLADIQALYVGRGSKDTTSSWDGLIDDLRFYDRELSQAEVTALFTSSPFPNTNPVADFSTALVNESASYYEVDGSLSTDPDGDAIALYEWDVDNDGIADAFGQIAQITNTEQSSLQVALTVHDVRGASHTATKTIDLTTLGVDLQINEPIDGADIFPGNNVITQAQITDPNTTIDRVEFYVDGSLIGEDTSTSPYSFDLGALTAGAREISVRAVNDTSNYTETSIITVNVLQPPVVTITSPSSPVTLNAGNSVVLESTVTEPNGGTIVNVEYFANGTKIGESAVAPYTLNYQVGWPFGNLTIEARATNDLGFSGSATTTHVTVNQGVDSDNDLIIDYYENLVGMNPSDPADALLDKDADRYPNIYEYLNGSFANDASSLPFPDFVIDVQNGGNSATDNIFLTIQEGVDAVASDYQIVLIKAGTYANPVTISGDPKMLIIGESGALNTIVDGTSFSGRIFSIAGELIIDSLHITGYSGQDQGGAINFISSDARVMRCIFSNNQTGSGIVRCFNSDVTFERCLFKNNEGESIYARFNSSLTLNHVTIFDNFDDTLQALAQVYLEASSVTVLIENSILWNASAIGEIGGVTSGATVVDSIVRGGFGSGLNVDPNLDLRGYLFTNSAPEALDYAVESEPDMDIHLELISGGTSFDLGADEFVDSEPDLIADWWENFYNASDPNGDLENSGTGDGLNNLQEYLNGSDPNLVDTDGDLLSDFDEVITYGTNPLDVDTDKDGIGDYLEVTNNLNPNDPNDAYEDPDEDRYPNIYELLNNSNPNDDGSIPNSDYIVDQVNGENSSTDNIYSTFQEAILATLGQSDYRVILVKPDTYTPTPIDIEINRPKMLLIAENGPFETIINGSLASSFVFRITNGSIVDGFTITQFDIEEDSPILLQGSFQGIYRCIFDELYTSNFSSEPVFSIRNRALIERCLFRDFSGKLMTVDVNSEVTLKHITAFEDQAIIIETQSNSQLDIENSILWSPTTVNFNGDNTGVSTSNSIVKGGFGGSTDIDPALDYSGFLTGNSSAALDVISGSVQAVDIHLEPLSGTTQIDLGADEFTDSDMDSISDYIELAAFNDLNVVNALTDDPDGDSLSVEYEILNGLELNTWEGVQNISTSSAVRNPGDAITITFEAFEPLDITLNLYRYDYDASGSSFTLMDQVAKSVAAGADSITWDGLIGNPAAPHNASVVVYELLSTETDGGGNAALYAPVDQANFVPESFFENLDLFTNSTPNPWRNEKFSFTMDVNKTGFYTTGNDTILDHAFFVKSEDEFYTWIASSESGAPLGSLFQSGRIQMSGRSVPESAIVYRDQEPRLLNYEIDDYVNTPALADVVQAEFELTRDAILTLELYDSSQNAYPLYYIDAQGNHALATNLNLSQGFNAIEFFTMDYTEFGSGKIKLFGPGTQNADRFLRVKFIIEQLNSGKTFVKWAYAEINQ